MAYVVRLPWAMPLQNVDTKTSLRPFANRSCCERLYSLEEIGPQSLFARQRLMVPGFRQKAEIVEHVHHTVLFAVRLLIRTIFSIGIVPNRAG